MLVISRKPGEGVWIGDYHVDVASVCGNKVRLAIDAPIHVKILRDEIRDRAIVALCPQCGHPRGASADCLECQVWRGTGNDELRGTA